MARFTLTSGNELLFDDGGMNLLSSSALHELRDLLSSAQPRDRATAQPLFFRSARPDIFAAGADMAEMQRFSPREAYEFARLGQEVFETIERAPFLTIAMIDGDCFGGALDLILAFDIRLATPRSRFAHPGARIGIVTGFGGTSRWRKVLTRPAANQLFLANRVFDANEALNFGLVDRVAESLDDEIARMSALDPAATQLVKELARGTELSRIELLRLAKRSG